MATTTNRIGQLVLQQLGGGEKRILSLVVAVRKALDRSEWVRGDLTEMVESALRKLVASESVVDVDGVYSLAVLN